MVEQMDAKEVVGFQELLMAQMIQLDAVTDQFNRFQCAVSSVVTIIMQIMMRFAAADSQFKMPGATRKGG